MGNRLCSDRYREPAGRAAGGPAAAAAAAQRQVKAFPRLHSDILNGICATVRPAHPPAGLRLACHGGSSAGTVHARTMSVLTGPWRAGAGYRFAVPVIRGRPDGRTL